MALSATPKQRRPREIAVHKREAFHEATCVAAAAPRRATPARCANVLSVNSAESIYTPWNFESDSRHARVGASPQEIALRASLGRTNEPDQ